jgi:hypothetical protein
MQVGVSLQHCLMLLRSMLEVAGLLRASQGGQDKRVYAVTNEETESTQRLSVGSGTLMTAEAGDE